MRPDQLTNLAQPVQRTHESPGPGPPASRLSLIHSPSGPPLDPRAVWIVSSGRVGPLLRFGACVISGHFIKGSGTHVSLPEKHLHHSLFHTYDGILRVFQNVLGSSDVNAAWCISAKSISDDRPAPLRLWSVQGTKGPRSLGPPWSPVIVFLGRTARSGQSGERMLDLADDHIPWLPYYLLHSPCSVTLPLARGSLAGYLMRSALLRCPCHIIPLRRDSTLSSDCKPQKRDLVRVSHIGPPEPATLPTPRRQVDTVSFQAELYATRTAVPQPVGQRPAVVPAVGGAKPRSRRTGISKPCASHP